MFRYLLVILAIGHAMPSQSQAQSQGVSGVSRQDHWDRLKQQISVRTSLGIHKVPLDRVVNALQARHGVSIVIDTVALEELAWDEKVLVSVDMNNASLASLLDAMLRPLEFTWTFRDDAITITSFEEEASHLVTRVYPISDFLAKAELSRGEYGNHYDTIIDTLVSTVVSDSWAENGTGDGDVSSFPAANALVISQSVRVHLKIEQLLADLRQARVAQGLTRYQEEADSQTLSPDTLQIRRPRTYLRPAGQWRAPRSYDDVTKNRVFPGEAPSSD